MKFSNKYNLPKSLVDVIVNKTYDISDSNPKRISVTTLINPPRQRILAVKHWKEIEDDVANHIWKVVGNACHYILTETDKSMRIVEEKMEEIVEDITIVAKPDLYNWDSQSIEDWKITSIWSLKLGDKEDWENQLNCYAWLLRRKGLPVKNVDINAILKDWRKNEIMKYDDYPKVPFERRSIKLWTFEKQEEYIKQRVKLYKEQMNLPLEQVAICSPKERWKKEDAYAIYKNKLKKASRVLDTKEEAEEWAATNIKTPDTYNLEKRPGLDLKCSDYCNVSKFCSYWKETYGRK